MGIRSGFNGMYYIRELRFANVLEAFVFAKKESMALPNHARAGHANGGKGSSAHSVFGLLWSAFCFGAEREPFFPAMIAMPVWSLRSRNADQWS